MSYNQAPAARACDECMESGRHKVLDADLHGALADFKTAAAHMESCAHAWSCCAALSFLLDEKGAAKEYAKKAERHSDGVHSDVSYSVYADIWDEYMNSIISINTLEGSDIKVDLEKSLPEVPKCFQTISKGPQKVRVKLLLTPKIKRAGDAVEVTLVVKNAEFSVLNSLETTEALGYFVHELRIDASPGKPWKESCELIATAPSDFGSSSHLVQNQSASTFGAQMGVSGPTPGGNISYTHSKSTSITSYALQMISGKAADQKVWMCEWKVNKYKNGQLFDAMASKVSELPFDPSRTHACFDPGSFRGTWKVTSDDARKLHYHFNWDITLSAKLALMPRGRKRDMFKPPGMSSYLQNPLRHVSSTSSSPMSDFSRTSNDRLLT